MPYLKPGIIGPKGFWYLGFGVALRLPIVRPWKELLKLTISCCSPEGCRIFPTFRANFMAASLASLPELQMNTLEASCMEPDSRVLETRSWERAPVQGL